MHLVDTEGCKWSEENWLVLVTPLKISSVISIHMNALTMWILIEKNDIVLIQFLTCLFLLRTSPSSTRAPPRAHNFKRHKY